MKIFSRLLIILIIFISGSCFSQSIKIFKRAEIDSILVSILGNDNFERHVKFNKKRSYESYLSKSYPLKKSNNDVIPNFYEFCYDLDLKIDSSNNDKIIVQVDGIEGFTKVSISGLPKCYYNLSECSNYISLDSVKKIAKNSGLAVGLTEWTNFLVWGKTDIEYLRNDSIKIIIEKGFYYWQISNMLFIAEDPESLSWGDSLIIDAITGKVIDRREIFMSGIY